MFWVYVLDRLIDSDNLVVVVVVVVVLVYYSTPSLMPPIKIIIISIEI